MLAAALALALSAFSPARAFAQQEKMGGMAGMPEGRAMGMSKYGFSETVSRVKQAITDQDLMVVFTADHQAMLSMVGKQSKGMLAIEFFHPRYGKTIFETNHAAGLEIPLRLVVMEGDMGTMLSYEKPSYTFARYKGLEGLGQALDGVLQTIVASVAK
ncbi:MAG: DUF302 domain-containing protein [Gemmatimonadetes bacterium]|nr:DUF302 domain-containing protein [Gemmatimonadota bacterium]